MSCKSGIYAINGTAGNSLAIGSTYAPLTIIRRFGKYTQLGGNGITLGGCQGAAGYYDTTATVTVTVTAAGPITATLYRDGAPIPGATATVTATAGQVVTLPLNALVRINCDCDSANITVVMSGGASTSQNLAIVAEKV